MTKFFAILINPKGRSVPNDAIQSRLDSLSEDWLRFSTNQYVVKYDGKTQSIYDEIKPLLDSKSNFLVIEVDIQSRSGWASKVAADWFKKHSP